MREVAGYIILFVFIIVFVVLSYFSTSFYRFVKVLKWTLCQVSVASMLNFSVLLAHLPNIHNLLRKRRIGIVFKIEALVVWSESCFTLAIGRNWFHLNTRLRSDWYFSNFLLIPFYHLHTFFYLLFLWGIAYEISSARVINTPVITIDNSRK